MKYHRRSIRLKSYDTTQPGAYFVTLVTWQRQCRFGCVVNEEARLSRDGEIVQAAWLRLPAFFSIRLGPWMIMPNHFHAILWLEARCTGEASAEAVWDHGTAADASPLPPNGTTPGSLGAIIQNFKSISVRHINQENRMPGAPVWQRNYYEHIVRNQAELVRIAAYIQSNPTNLKDDKEYIAS